MCVCVCVCVRAYVCVHVHVCVVACRVIMLLMMLFCFVCFVFVFFSNLLALHVQKVKLILSAANKRKIVFQEQMAASADGIIICP